jgi:putative Ca2+/H+ antiporter (TMEM165/GDT1 family)
VGPDAFGWYRVVIQIVFATFALVFLAELGDKTQLLVAWLATRFRPWQVMAGVLLGSAAIHVAAVLAGATVGAVLPAWLVEGMAGLLFLAFALWAFREARSADEDTEEPAAMSRTPVLGIAAAFFLAELGDKTQLVVVARAAQLVAADGSWEAGPILATWAGAVLAMVAANGLAVLLGSFLGTRIRRRNLALASGVLFAAFGIFTLVRAAVAWLA